MELTYSWNSLKDFSSMEVHWRWLRNGSAPAFADSAPLSAAPAGDIGDKEQALLLWGRGEIMFKLSSKKK